MFEQIKKKTTIEAWKTPRIPLNAFIPLEMVYSLREAAMACACEWGVLLVFPYFFFYFSFIDQRRTRVCISMQMRALCQYNASSLYTSIASGCERRFSSFPSYICDTHLLYIKMHSIPALAVHTWLLVVYIVSAGLSLDHSIVRHSSSMRKGWIYIRTSD